MFANNNSHPNRKRLRDLASPSFTTLEARFRTLIEKHALFESQWSTAGSHPEIYAPLVRTLKDFYPVILEMQSFLTKANACLNHAEKLAPISRQVYTWILGYRNKINFLNKHTPAEQQCQYDPELSSWFSYITQETVLADLEIEGMPTKIHSAFLRFNSEVFGYLDALQDGFSNFAEIMKQFNNDWPSPDLAPLQKIEAFVVLCENLAGAQDFLGDLQDCIQHADQCIADIGIPGITKNIEEITKHLKDHQARILETIRSVYGETTTLLKLYDSTKTTLPPKLEAFLEPWKRNHPHAIIASVDALRQFESQQDVSAAAEAFANVGNKR